MDKKFTILAVDDSKSNLLLIEALIQDNLDVNLIKAINAKEAIETVLKEEVDLILSDVEMPDINGFEFARKIKKSKKYEHIPIIFITARHINDDSIQEGLDIGAVDYITKPINSNILISKLKVFINLYNTQANLKDVNKKLKKHIKKIKEQEAQIIQQSRMAQMGEMISMIAHQWRQPLASISTIASTIEVEIMLEQCEPDFLESKLNEISNISEHLSKTIDDFRNFFKPDNEEQLFTVSDVVEEVLQLNESFLSDINVIKSIKTKTQIFSYKNELGQVLLNILKNGVDAIEQKKISNGEILINVFEKDQKTLNITIEDNAGGIDSENIDKIFEPYFSTKSKNETGLGLYMSKMIIEKHCNGKIKALNSQKGATFIISLPINSKRS